MPFAKHETFHIREGWLFKGMDAVCRDSTIFLARDASERLGLGKNMVRALRFWMTATGLTEAYRQERRTCQRLTVPFGQWVWEHDRYLEEEGTLWLIHYHLVREQENATAWYWFFNHFSQPVFDQHNFTSTLQSWVIGKGKPVSENSLKRDFDCLIRTYLPSRQARSPEDLLECPLTQLGLLAEADNGQARRYRLLRLDATRIHPLVLLYVLLQWQQRNQPEARQVGLAQVLRAPANAGRVFNLSTASLSNGLTRLSDEHPNLAVRLTRTAGLDQLTLPQATPNQVLAHYFEGQR